VSFSLTSKLDRRKKLGGEVLAQAKKEGKGNNVTERFARSPSLREKRRRDYSNMKLKTPKRGEEEEDSVLERGKKRGRKRPGKELSTTPT